MATTRVLVQRTLSFAKPVRFGSVAVNGITFALEWKVADCWIGLYWHSVPSDRETWRHVWLCLLPMLPIHASWHAWSVQPAAPPTGETNDGT